MSAPALPRTGWIVLAIFFTATAVTLRSAQYGNPIQGLDEQFYLLVGDRMWAGAVPYVDLWDRKPFGLFALFAGLRLLGGDGVVQAQIVATFCATATALIVTAIALRSASRVAAVLAGLFYLVALQMLWGGTTQTPVFYNLPIAAAAWLVLRSGPALDTLADRRRAAAAILLCGLAIQIKTNAVFEGGLLGIWLVWRLWRSGAAAGRVAAHALGFALLGLAPTLAVVAGYAAIGHADAWWFANVESLLLKRGTAGPAALLRLSEMAGLVAPIALIAAVGLARRVTACGWNEETALIAAWCAVALVDAIALGGFWPHYALPFTLPASIAAAHAFAAPRWGQIAFAVLAAYPLVDAVVLDRVSAANERRIAAATLKAIPADVTTRCLFVYEGPVIYYHLSRAYLVTKFAFTDHLRSSAEAAALGEDAGAALLTALAKRPGTVITLDGSLWHERNRTNDAIIARALAQDYRVIARARHRNYSVGRETIVLWRRRDLR